MEHKIIQAQNVRSRVTRVGIRERWGGGGGRGCFGVRCGAGVKNVWGGKYSVENELTFVRTVGFASVKNLIGCTQNGQMCKWCERYTKLQHTAPVARRDKLLQGQSLPHRKKDGADFWAD